MIITHAKSLYKVDIIEEEIDKLESNEPFVNFNYRQAELLRRSFILQKFCYPILQEIQDGIKVDEEIKNLYNDSFMNTYLFEAQACFKFGLFLSTIILCRSVLEVGLREIISHIKANSIQTSFVREYASLEWTTLGELIKKAEKIGLLNEGEINDIFSLFSGRKNGSQLRKLLDKFVHGSYSDLFLLVKDISIEDSKAENFEEFIKKLQDMDEKHFGKYFSKRTYAIMTIREELALFFLQVIFTIRRKIFFEKWLNFNN